MQQAELRYDSGAYQVIKPGHFVVCAVTGRQIMLEDLRYWDAELQEAYVDAATATGRYEERRDHEREAAGEPA
jgi:hypothetical protein